MLQCFVCSSIPKVSEKKWATGQSFIQKEITSYRIGTLAVLDLLYRLYKYCLNMGDICKIRGHTLITLARKVTQLVSKMLTFAKVGYLVPPEIDNVSIKERKINKMREKLHIQTFNINIFIQIFMHTMLTVNDILVDPYLFLILVNPYPFYCIKKIWIDQNKKRHGSTKTSLKVHACINTFEAGQTWVPALLNGLN